MRAAAAQIDNRVVAAAGAAELDTPAGALNCVGTREVDCIGVPVYVSDLGDIRANRDWIGPDGEGGGPLSVNPGTVEVDVAAGRVQLNVVVEVASQSAAERTGGECADMDIAFLHSVFADDQGRTRVEPVQLGRTDLQISGAAGEPDRARDRVRIDIDEAVGSDRRTRGTHGDDEVRGGDDDAGHAVAVGGVVDVDAVLKRERAARPGVERNRVGRVQIPRDSQARHTGQHDGIGAGIDRVDGEHAASVVEVDTSRGTGRGYAGGAGAEGDRVSAGPDTRADGDGDRSGADQVRVGSRIAVNHVTEPAARGDVHGFGGEEPGTITVDGDIARVRVADVERAGADIHVGDVLLGDDHVARAGTEPDGARGRDLLDAEIPVVSHDGCISMHGPEVGREADIAAGRSDGVGAVAEGEALGRARGDGELAGAGEVEISGDLDITAREHGEIGIRGEGTGTAAEGDVAVGAPVRVNSKGGKRARGREAVNGHRGVLVVPDVEGGRVASRAEVIDLGVADREQAPAGPEPDRTARGARIQVDRAVVVVDQCACTKHHIGSRDRDRIVVGRCQNFRRTALGG